MSAVGPSSTRRPPLMMAMRSHSFCATSSTCVLNSTLPPSSHTRRRIALHHKGGLRVQPHKGLVQNQQPWLAHQRRNKRQLLLHAVAVASNSTAQGLRKLESTGIFLYAAGALVCRDAVDIRNKGKVLHARHEFIQIRVVRQKGRHLLCGHRFAHDVVAVYFDSALRKIQNTCRTAQRVVLPAPLWPMKPTICPAGTVRLKSSTARFPPGYVLEKWLIFSINIFLSFFPGPHCGCSPMTASSFR